MLTLSVQPAEFNRHCELKTKPSLLLVAWMSWDESTSPGTIIESEKSRKGLKASDLMAKSNSQNFSPVDD